MIYFKILRIESKVVMIQSQIPSIVPVSKTASPHGARRATAAQTRCGAAASLLVLFLLCTVTPILHAQSGSVLISEFATRGGAVGNAAGEFVELYNPSPVNIDISGWKLQYRSAAGSSYSPIATLPVGSVIKARSYFLLVGPTWGGTPAGNASWTGSGIADNGGLRLVNAADVEIDRVGYGTGNDPKVAAAPNHGDAANDNSVERKASAASTAATMAAGGAEQHAGNGYNSNNNAADFIVRTTGRDPQNAASAPEPRSDDGSGTARTIRTAMRAGEIGDVPIIYRRDPAYAVTSLKIVVPAGFTWSRDAADVDVSAQSNTSVIEDSVFVENIAFANDSLTITLANLTAPSTTSSYPFMVYSRGSAGSYFPLQTQPSVLVSGAPIPIAEARANDASGVPVLLNQFVTVDGIVTVGNQFGAPAYMEDATGGVAVYAFDFSDQVQIGEEVTVTGKVTHFNGLTELVEVMIEAKLPPSGEVAPRVVTIAQLLADGAGGREQFESGLVRINGVTVNTQTWTVNGSGTNYKITDATGEMDVRIDNNVDLAGTPAPGGSFDIVGIVSQFKNASPYIGGYQLMPRMKRDIIATGPGITTTPIETDITPTSVTLAWQTGKSAASHVRYGVTDAYEAGIAAGGGAGTEHEVTITGLSPATIYRVQPFSIAAGDTSFAQPFFVSSASATSTGALNVYFNRSVESSLLPSFPAQGNQNLKNRLLDRIDRADFSIDLALYSLSGSVGDEIASSLIAAHNRGVKIRMIFEADNANTAAIRALRNAGVPQIVDSFDPLNAGAGLMHNKFVVIDGRDRSSDTDDWIITGSWNPTDPGTDNDAQNVVEIQDQSLAVTYTKEFEEMWGSATATPNSTASRFGVRKRADTPRRFVVGGIWMDVHFSPSDRTNDYLLRTIRGAARSIYFALLTFTRDDLGQEMLAAHRAGKTVRGVMDNSSDQGSEFAFFQTNGMDVLLKKGLSGLLHHKYMVVDPETASGRVVTGSHNWSNAAEFANNENTIGIASAAVARQFVQEWYRRYLDAGGAGSVVLGVSREPSAAAFALAAPWPNPAMASTGIAFTTTSMLPARLALVDALGREVAVLTDGVVDAGRWQYRIDVSALPAGVYQVVLTQAGRTAVRPLQIVR